MDPYAPSSNQIPPGYNNPPQNIEMGMVQPQMIGGPQNNNYQQPQYGYAQPAYPQYNATQATYIQMQQPPPQPIYIQVNQGPQQDMMPHQQMPAQNSAYDDQPPQHAEHKSEKNKNAGSKGKKYRTSQRDTEDMAICGYICLLMCCRSRDSGNSGCCTASFMGGCCKVNFLKIKGCCCKVNWCDIFECCGFKSKCDIKLDCCDCQICGDDN